MTAAPVVGALGPCAAPKDEHKLWLGCCGAPSIAVQWQTYWVAFPDGRVEPRKVRRQVCPAHRVSVFARIPRVEDPEPWKSRGYRRRR